MTTGAFSSAFSPAFATDSADPVPVGGFTGLSAREQLDAAAAFFGEDIWLDIAAPDVTLGEANYVTTPAGDIAVVTGREALRQSLMRRTITRPGEMPTLPDYGVGAGDYVKAKNTPAIRAELESRIRAQYLRDPRVLSVQAATVAQLDDGSEGIKIAVSVIPRGRLRSDQPLPIQLEIR